MYFRPRFPFLSNGTFSPPPFLSLTITLRCKNEKHPSGPIELDLEAGNLVNTQKYLSTKNIWNIILYLSLIHLCINDSYFIFFVILPCKAYIFENAWNNPFTFEQYLVTQILLFFCQYWPILHMKKVKVDGEIFSE